MIRILFLSANPNNADTLLAGDELRQIEAALKGSRFEVIAKPAARLEDLPELLRQSKAAIVHFSGYGTKVARWSWRATLRVHFTVWSWSNRKAGRVTR